MFSLRFLTVAVLTASALTALSGCTAELQGEAKLPELGRAEASSGDPASSDALPEIASFSLLGTRVSSAFHRDGIVHIYGIAKDAKGAVILDGGVHVKTTVTANLPFPLKASVKVAGVQKPRSTSPFQMAVSLDSSGSMSSSDKNRSRVGAAKGFVNVVNTRFPGSEFGVWDFDDEVREQTSFTNNLDLINAAIDKAKEGGGTAMHKASMMALNALEQKKKPELQQGLLVLSDGMDNASDGVTANDVIQKAKANSVPIYALALGGALDIPGLNFVTDLQRYAAETNGVFAYAKDAASLQRSFENIATGASQGFTDIEINLSGGTYVAFMTINIEFEVRSGKKVAKDSFEFIVPTK
jgi:hypothetical protein